MNSSFHLDRLVNPYNRTGVHKSLRKISKNIREKFHNLPENAKICHTCRKYDPNKSSDSLLDDSCDSINFDNSNSSTYDDLESLNKKLRFSREAELEMLLTGLKEKYKSLSINDPMRVSILTICPDCWSIPKIMSEFDAAHYMAQKAIALKKSQGILSSPVLRKGKRLPEATVHKVKEFYESDENSRVMPNKKDTVSVRIDGIKTVVPKRLILGDVKYFHKEFKVEYPSFPIGLSKFAELRPKWCVLAGSSGTHSVCVCTIHQNFKAMIDAADLPKLTKNKEIKFNDYKYCIVMVVTCRNPKEACYLRECKKCSGFEKFSDYVSTVLEDTGISQVIFSTWKATDRCTLIKQCLSVDDFVEELTEHLKLLIPHNFISKEQTKYIKTRKENVKENEVLVQCDFSENYAYVAQNAVQAFHYNNDQCSIHSVIFYYRCGDELKHSGSILLSDSTTHDTAFVYIMQQTIIPLIKTICPKVTKIIYSSDGAKQHYKNRYQMCNLVHHQEDFGIEAEWHYFATSHGKGPNDGQSAVLKKEATRYSLQVKPNDAILASKPFFEWAKNKFKSLNIFYYSKKDHQNIQRKLNKRFSSAPKVSKIQSSHSFIVTNKTLNVYRYSNAKKSINTVSY